MVSEPTLSAAAPELRGKAWVTTRVLSPPFRPINVFKLGHWGSSLLVWAPIGGALIVGGYPALAVIGGVGMLVLSRIPDHDHDLPLIEHRGVTHTLLFAAIVGAVVGALGFAVGSSPIQLAGLDIGQAFGLEPAPGLGAFGFAVGSLGILAHLFADALTPAGVPLFWPISRNDYSLYVAQASNTVANYGLFVLGIVATIVAAVAAVRL